jgi:hypothetical protein
VSAIVNDAVDVWLEKLDRKEEKQKAIVEKKNKCRATCCIGCDFSGCVAGVQSKCLWPVGKVIAESSGFCDEVNQCRRFVPLPAKSLKSE